MTLDVSTNLARAEKDRLQQHQVSRLRRLVEFLQLESSNQFYREKLAHISPASIMNPADFARLPFTHKSELVREQTIQPPFGRNLSYPLEDYVKLHQTSGTTGRPLRVLDTRESWEWWAQCWVQVYDGAGVNQADRIFFAFSFGPFIGFWAAYEGAARLGALAIPGGGMDTEQRLAAILEQSATVICCTPSYSLYLAETAARQGLDLTAGPVRVLLLAGEPGASIPAVRERIEQAWGAKCYDHAGASEIGAWGFSCSEQNGLHINESEFIAEVLEPGRDVPVAPGETGELVLTNLGRAAYPVIRYRTGDSVRVADGPCRCGRTYRLLEGGVIGRTDSMVTVRGINIFPSSVEAIIREVFPGAEFRLVFTRQNNLDELEVKIEAGPDEQNLVASLEALFRLRLALRVPVTPVPVDSLPRFQLKARRIEDRRQQLA